MARTPQVTRTIQTTKVNVLCLNIMEGNPFNQTVVLPRTYKDDKHMLKAVEKLINSDTVKAVHVVDSVVEETLYGMSEQKFIELASVLPPRKSTDKDGDIDTDNEDEDTTNEGETEATADVETEAANESETVAPVEGETATAAENEADTNVVPNVRNNYGKHNRKH